MNRRTFIASALVVAAAPNAVEAAHNDDPAAVFVRGRIVDLAELHTTTGKVMARFGVRFWRGKMPVIAFPETWMAARGRVYEGAIVTCYGDLSNGHDGPCIVARHVNVERRRSHR